MKPKEFFPDGLDAGLIKGQMVRKGSIGAFIQNVLILSDPKSDIEARREAEADLVALLPSMKALQVFETFEIRDPEIRRLVASRLDGI